MKDGILIAVINKGSNSKLLKPCVALLSSPQRFHIAIASQVNTIKLPLLLSFIFHQLYNGNIRVLFTGRAIPLCCSGADATSGSKALDHPELSFIRLWLKNISATHYFRSA